MVVSGVAKILIIDDDADSREAVAAYLSKGGHTVRAAANGRQALEAVSEEVPDAILLDVRMPGMDGIAVLDVLRSYLRWDTVPIAMFTAYPEDPRLWHVAQKGVDRVFAKSKVDFAEVLAWVYQRTRRQPPPEPPGPHLGA